MQTQTTNWIEGVVALDNARRVAVFKDFDNAVEFRALHPSWEVHIHLVLPRAIPDKPVTAYLTDGERVYATCIIDPAQLAPPHPYPRPDGVVWWEARR